MARCWTWTAASALSARDLNQLVRDSQIIKLHVERLSARAPAFAIEQAALAGLFGETPDPARAAARLDLYAEESDGAWSGRAGASHHRSRLWTRRLYLLAYPARGV